MDKKTFNKVWARRIISVGECAVCASAADGGRKVDKDEKAFRKISDGCSFPLGSTRYVHMLWTEDGQTSPIQGAGNGR